jgi:membrane-associated protein
MKIITTIFDLFMHLDKHLTSVIDTWGVWSYVLLFLVIFMETGLVVTPFLPGDSLIFAAGTLAAMDAFNIIILYITILVAAFIGDTVNYWIGHAIGPKAFKLKNRFIKQEYLAKAQRFYEKHGGKAIILSRFVPIVRTFAPFVAGIGTMEYKKFLLYNLIGGWMWVSLFVFGGYFFGNLPFVKNNFHYFVLAIILISLIPIVIEIIGNKRTKTALNK